MEHNFRLKTKLIFDFQLLWSYYKLSCGKTKGIKQSDKWMTENKYWLLMYHELYQRKIAVDGMKT